MAKFQWNFSTRIWQVDTSLFPLITWIMVSWKLQKWSNDIPKFYNPKSNYMTHFGFDWKFQCNTYIKNTMSSYVKPIFYRVISISSQLYFYASTHQHLCLQNWTTGDNVTAFCHYWSSGSRSMLSPCIKNNDSSFIVKAMSKHERL